MSVIKMRPAVYANHKRKDGSYPVKIVIYFKGKERKLPTNIVCYPQHLTRTLKLKQAEPLHLAQEEIRKWHDACKDLSTFDLEYRDVDFVVNHIKAKLAKDSFRLDFFKFAEQVIEDRKPGTKEQYMQSLKAFSRFLGKTEIDINQISRSMVVAFIDFVNKEPHMYYRVKDQKCTESKKQKLAGGQASRHVMKLNAIFKAAQKKYNDEEAESILIPRSPFSNHEIEKPMPQGQKPQPKEIIQRLIHAQVENENVRMSIDISVVSLGLMGANLADLFEANEPTGNVWVYNRKKTRDKRPDRAEMRVDVPECLRPYIERLRGRKKGIWLGKLREIGNDSSYVSRYVNAGLAKWCEQEGIETFTFYAIRKSWATLARKAGVEKALVDEGLAHVGDYKMTDIYAERPWDKINEANSKVLELFDWN